MSWFGGTKIKQYDILNDQQKAYQGFLQGQSEGLGGMTMDSSYAGGYANQAYGDMQNALRSQMNQALVDNRHSSRFHGSGQGYRDARIRNQFSQTMTDLAYKHSMTQQDWMQQYAQKAKDWNYTGKYQAMAMLSDPILAQQKGQYTQDKPGVLDFLTSGFGLVNTGLNIGNSISSWGSGTGTGGASGPPTKQ